MRIHNDADTTIGVRWYFADEDAPWLNSYTRFASRNWDSEKGLTSGLGEVGGAPRPFSDGKAPKGLIGDHICGTLKMFEEGGSVDDPKICTDNTGVSSCCIDKLWCCDLFQMGPSIELVVVAASEGFPIPSHIGKPGMSFTLLRQPLVFPDRYVSPFPVELPGSLSSFFAVITCVNNVISLEWFTGTGVTLVITNNTKANPIGALFEPGDLSLRVPGFTVEQWQFAIGTNPGPFVPPDPGPTPGFPPGTFPPRLFPPGTFPGP